MALTRIFDVRLLKLLRTFPAVGLIGPRQAGKTTAAKLVQRQLKKPAIYLDLESPSDFRRFSDPELFLTELEDTCVIIDEVQRMPELFPLLRSLIDRNRKPGRFLLLGSASPELVAGVSESLAGRISYLEAHPFHILELPDRPTTQRKHWFRGGFPDAWKARSDDARFEWTDNFVRTFVERDLNMLFGTSFSPQVMFRLWRMLAHHHGGAWNAQSIAKALDMSPTTVNRYVDFLEGAFMLRRLAPYHANTRKRLSKTPKVYVRDSGLLHYLLDINRAADLLSHPSVGHSWEGHVIEQIIALLPRTIQPFYYRTHDGAEMDLLLVKGVAPIASIEVKLTLSPTVTRGMRESIKELDTAQNFIITPQDSPSYPIADDIRVVGLREFVTTLLPKLVK